MKVFNIFLTMAEVTVIINLGILAIISSPSQSRTIAVSSLLFMSLSFYLLQQYNQKQKNKTLLEEYKALQLKFEDVLDKANKISEEYIRLSHENIMEKGENLSIQNQEENQSKPTIHNENCLSMNDVAGYEEVKEELYEIVDFLKSPQKYINIGAKLPKGILFEGPPGTGKTLFARAIAGEAGVHFIHTAGSEFVEKYVGVGAKRVRELFERARKTKEPCIIFIDEIDALASNRQTDGTNIEGDKTLNQLLVEMDGFQKDSQIIVIAATNRKDILDSAILRPGRFDRHITIGLPNQKERLAILKKHIRNKKMAQDIDLDELARKTISFSGAQLESVLNEAALLAVRNNREVISNEYIDEAIDRVLMGPAKKSTQYIEKEKNMVAYHEAGHAVIGLKLQNAMKVEKITIIPRGDAGGYNLFSEKEEKFFFTKQEILAKITGLLAGRAAEDLMFDDITTGASNDIEKATNLARNYVCTYGMSSLGLAQMNSNQNISEKTSQKIDEEVERILKECYKKSQNLLSSHKNLLDAIAHELLEKEVIDSSQIERIEQQCC